VANREKGVPDESAILHHAESPYHRGRAPHASCAHTERNAACGDWVRLELVLDADGRVQQSWFEGGGCLISQAAAILCRAVEGKAIGELWELTAQQMLDWLETPLTPRRMQCGLLPFKVLKTMVYSLCLTTGAESREPREEQ
jgi:nitrogen fixation protein NifU and related proteins